MSLLKLNNVLGFETTKPIWVSKNKKILASHNFKIYECSINDFFDWTPVFDWCVIGEDQ